MRNKKKVAQPQEEYDDDEDATPDTMESVNVASGTVNVLQGDCVKKNFKTFKKHLQVYSPMSEMTISKTVRLGRVFLVGDRGEQQAFQSWTENHVYDQILASLLPGGILKRKDSTRTAAVCHMLVSSLNKMLDFC